MKKKDLSVLKSHNFQAHLESTYQDLLCTLETLSGCICDNPEIVCNLDAKDTCDLDTVKHMIEQNRVLFVNHTCILSSHVMA